MPPKKQKKSSPVNSGGSTTVLPDVKPQKNAKKTKPKINPEDLPSQAKIEEKLTTARIGLLIREPFFGSMATRLKLIRDDDMPTAATDGRNFYYNLEFIAGLTIKETEFLFGHEVLHNVFEHHLRKSYPDGENIESDKKEKQRHHLAWNIACDYAVNEILIESKIGDKIEHTLYDEKYKGWCAEQIYDDLMKNAKTGDLESLAEMLLDEHLDGKDVPEEERQKIKNEIKQSLMDSYQAAAGNVPQGVDRLVKSITSPKISWKEELRQNIQSIKKYDYTFYKPSRKGLYNGVVLPGMKRDEDLDICVAIDCSGSISDDDLRTFLSEISGIMSQYDDYSIRIWSFDTEVYNDETFKSDDSNDITTYQPKGGGGTLFECNWEYMKANEINPRMFIMFTDMQPGSKWGDPDYCEDVIFVAYKAPNIEAPFGRTIHLN